MSSITVLLSSLPGLALPKTTALSIPSSATYNDLRDEISALLPGSLTVDSLRLTTTSSHEITPSSARRLSSLVSPSYTTCQNHGTTATTTTTTTTTPSLFLSLRLSAPLCGGKGGFGSQLRAAGGRMSSRRKGRGANAEEDNGSSRNLDGRRLRTVTEAKALAEYLALKPGMDKKAKEARRERWEKVVEAAERTQEELRAGASGKGKAKIDGGWMEDKEEAAERAREAVCGGGGVLRTAAWPSAYFLGGGPKEYGSFKEASGRATCSGASSSSSLLPPLTLPTRPFCNRRWH
ncbi:hypothetical protein KEM52_001759 [Ascosphaera acerosa]|nr:hypothetical protein KEM52_001759 [Ascosphaera acerosa]